MSEGISLFGIRHHGPGCARSLLAALEALQPDCVLIEGPAGTEALLPHVLEAGMQPPVALLCYPRDDPASMSFWPFAKFSPAYQAAPWAVGNGAALRFIDLPSSARVAPADDAQNAADDETEAKAEIEAPPHLRDPIGTLAQAAGYEDG
ncbi:hypothetical protein EN821_33690, partial [Mesorhizobium sp. M2D.F.Ca.ET.178.01.1.1]|uniref:DUF5682 family protein n=1 Tax=Mesorhizobium sp. M2D.F.Ca.ET.178.01.1.1 TaxID=2563937 RepID=UPI00113D4DF8